MPGRGHPGDDLTPPPVNEPDVLIPHGGMWATVIDHDNTAVTATLTVDNYDDQGKFTFGPVRYVIAGGTGDIDDSPAFLHFDDQDQPAYAVIWREG